MQKVGIINYGMGNLRSVANACRHLGATVHWVEQPTDLDNCSHLILPGVGAFGDGMRNLVERNLVAALRTAVMERGRPFLGICLGMQLIAARGTEFGDHVGLGWIPGTVVKLTNTEQVEGFRLPHIGWNDVALRPDTPLAQRFAKPPCFYFVHSFVLKPDDPNHVVGWSTHGERFPAILQRHNILATQFHPEKSQHDGLTLLRYFLGQGN